MATVVHVLHESFHGMSSNGAQSSRPEGAAAARARVLCAFACICAVRACPRGGLREASSGRPVMARFGCGVSGRTCAREHITPASFCTNGRCTIPHGRRLRVHAHACMHSGHVPPTVFTRTHARADRPAQSWTDAQPTHVRPAAAFAVCFRPRGLAMSQSADARGRSAFGTAARMRASENSAATCSATAPPWHNATPVRPEGKRSESAQWRGAVCSAEGRDSEASANRH